MSRHAVRTSSPLRAPAAVVGISLAGVMAVGAGSVVFGSSGVTDVADAQAAAPTDVAPIGSTALPTAGVLPDALPAAAPAPVLPVAPGLTAVSLPTGAAPAGPSSPGASTPGASSPGGTSRGGTSRGVVTVPIRSTGASTARPASMMSFGTPDATAAAAPAPARRETAAPPASSPAPARSAGSGSSGSSGGAGSSDSSGPSESSSGSSDSSGGGALLGVDTPVGGLSVLSFD